MTMSIEQPAQDHDQSCPNCEALTKQVTALKTCLEVERGFREQEQPAQQQEPVAVYVGETWCGSVVRLYEDLPLETPLYTSPSASKPFDTHAAPGQSFDTHSRTPQPIKPWVGLTDEDLLRCLGPEAVRIPPGWHKLARSIEAKLRELNEHREKNA